MSESFAELLEESFSNLNMQPGTIVDGTVVEVRNDVVVVNAGLKSEGVIPIDQFKTERGEVNVAVGDTVGTDVEEIRSKLEAEGYTVTEIEIEDGEIEVEYVVDGQEYEITMSGETGQVLEVELEDDDEDDD